MAEDCPAIKIALGKELSSIARELQLPGATAAVVMPDGEVVEAATGFADVEAGIKMTTQHRLMAGSIGKTWVAATALALVSEDKMALDAPISRWLGEKSWFDKLPNGEDITVAQLLNHSSGLPDHLSSPEFQREVTGMISGGDTRPIAPEQLVAMILEQPALFPAGSGWSYTDTNYIVLGLVLEAAGGFNLNEEMVKRFIYPLGLTSTEPTGSLYPANMAPGYVTSRVFPELPEKGMDRGVLIWSPATEWTGGGFLTTSRDLSVWMKALFEGRAMEGNYLGDMLGRTNPHIKDGRPKYALGVSVGKEEEGKVWGHDGVYPGYQASTAYYPDHGISLSYQANRDVVKDYRQGKVRQRLAKVLIEKIAQCRSK